MTEIEQLRKQAKYLQARINDGEQGLGPEVFHINQRISELKKQTEEDTPWLYVIQHPKGGVSAVVGTHDTCAMQLQLFKERPGWLIVNCFRLSPEALEEVPDEYCL